MLQGSRGSASLLFMVVVLPFLFIMLVVGIEVSQFLGAREEVQRILDAEAKLSLGRGYGASYVSRRIASRTESLKPYVSLMNVVAKNTPQQSSVTVQGEYQGTFAILVRSMMGGEGNAIPFEISATVRRAHTAVLILLDRTVGVDGVRCGEGNLSLRAGLVARLVEELQSLGVTYVQVGVTPGESQEIDILSATDEVPRCDGSYDNSRFRSHSVEGVNFAPIGDALSVAYRAIEILFSPAIPATTEQRAIIVVAPPLEARTEAITTIFSILEAEAVRQKAKVNGVGIAVGDFNKNDLFRVRGGSGRVKYLHVSEDEAVGSDLRIALAHDVQGRTFIAR